ncbi:MAG: hypothetical protein PF450_04275 [Bacteroidales bacterium]|jgi:hypothetical protein|nr:hypothetical protein [Bacteroidales bacterium]
MKALKPSLIILLFLAGTFSGMQAQASQSELNQEELIKQFIGNWDGELGIDTLFVGKNEAFGAGMLGSFDVIAQGEIIGSVKQLIGYDQVLDKYILSELIEASPVIEVCHLWFTSEKTGEIIVVNPKDTPLRWTFEFKTPEILVQTAFMGGEVYKVATLHKVDMLYDK